MPKTEPQPQTGVGATPGGHFQNNKQLMEHIRSVEADRAKYLLENKVLESKLRGYQTLGNLLQEAKQELRKYKAHNDELLETLASLTSSQSSTQSKTPVSPISPAGTKAPPGGHGNTDAQEEASSVPKDEKEAKLPNVAKLTAEQKLMISSVDSNEIYGAKNKDTSSNESSTVVSPFVSSARQSVTGVHGVAGTESCTRTSVNAVNTEGQVGLESELQEKLSIAFQPSDDVTSQGYVMGGGQETAAENAGSTDVKGFPKKDEDSGVGAMAPPAVSRDSETSVMSEGGNHGNIKGPIQAWPSVQPRLPSFDDTWEVSGCLTVDSAVFDDEFCVEISRVSESSSDGTPAGSLSLPHLRSSSCSSSSIQPASPSDPETSFTPNIDNTRSHGPRHEANISVQVQDLTKVLSDAVGMETSDLAPKLTRIALDALRMEKQLKTSQTLIESLSNENERLKVKIHISVPEKDRLNATLRIENDMLLNKVRLMERERDEMPPVKESSPTNGWVHVNDQQQEQQGATQEEVKQTDAGSLQQKYHTLQDKVQELSKANEKWVGHCDNMKDDFERQVQTLQRDLAISRSQLAEKDEQEKKRQNDIDRILLAAKKRAEDAEAAREEALNSLHVERQRRAHFEELHALEMQRCVELEQRVSQMEAQQAEQAVTGGAPSLISAAVSNLDSLAVMSASDLRTEVQVLRQQIIIYKDDFDTERHDREKALHELDDVKHKLARYKQEHNQEQRQVAELARELERVKEENTQLEVDLATKREEIVRLEGERSRIYPAPQAPPAVSPTWNASSNVAGAGLMHEWNCPRCTYKNIPQRTTCELCGKTRVPVPTEGWKCPSCTYLNPAGQSSCSICDQPNPRDPWRQNLMRERAGHRHLVSRGGEECDLATRPSTTPRYTGFSPMQNPTDDLVMDSLAFDDPTGRK